MRGGRAAAAASLLVLVVVSAPLDAAVELVVTPVEGPRADAVPRVQDFSFHLAPFDPLASPRSFPCGLPIRLPEGSYYAWVEGPARISNKTVVHVPPDGGPQPPIREVALAVGPAGRAALAGDWQAPESSGAVVRLLSVESHRDRGVLRNEFARSVPVAVAREGVRMPVGEIVGAVVDPTGPTYLQLTRPVVVREGVTADLHPAPPSDDRAHLVMRWERPEAQPHADDDEGLDLHVVTTAEAAHHKPNVLVRSMARLYAIWYDLPPGRVTVRLKSREYWADPIDVQLSEGGVSFLEHSLEKRATLDVTLVLPPELDGESTVVKVEAGGEVVEVQVESAFPAEVVIQAVPPRPAAVEALVGPWEFAGSVDLSSGDDRLVLAPEVARISGRVSVAGEEAQAAVSFLTNRSSRGKEVVSRRDTDVYGEFSVVVFPNQVQPLVLVSVGGREPLWWWLEPFPPRDGDRLEIEIEGPPADVRVVDAVTGDGVSGANVSYGWDGEGGGGRESTTDVDGLVRLPPIPARRFDLVARADGYRPVRRTVVTSAIETGSEIVLQLEPQPKGRQRSVRLPDGSAAVGAEVAILPSEDSVPRWVARADEHGEVSIAEGRPDEILAARHDRGGLVVMRMGELGDSIRLGAPGGPLTVHVVGPDETPASFAPVVLWIDGYRFQGGALAWLTESAFATDRGGTWTARHLSARPVEIVAWSRGGDPDDDTAAAGGVLDYRRQPIRPPWPAPAVVEAVIP